MTSADLARAASAAAAVLALCACTDWAGYDLDEGVDAVPVFSTMREDVVPDPYEMLREPAPGTVPVLHPLGDVPAPYTQAQIDSIAPLLSNPLRPTPEVLARGQVMYAANCAVCHGPTGAGDGPVIDAQNKFPYALPLNGGTAAARSDGYLYAVVDVGRGFMPAYGYRMTHLDRWAVVTYMRHLQGRAGATAAPATAPAPAPAAAAPAVPAPTPAAGTVDTAAGAGGVDTAAGGAAQPSAATPPAAPANPSSTAP